MSSYHAEPDIIEDSEPERERARHVTQKTRKQRNIPRREVSSNDPTPFATMNPPSPSRILSEYPPNERLRAELSRKISDEVILIDPSSPPSEKEHHPKTTSVVAEGEVIDISDSDESEDVMRKQLSRFRHGNPNRTPSMSRGNSSASNPNSRSLSSDSCASTRLEIAQQVSKTGSSLSRTSSIPPLEVPKRGRMKTSTPPFASAFSDHQLKLLERCVSCELGWTARKTVIEKMKHLQACAKKFRLEDETVIVLIQQELEQMAALDKGGKGKLHNPEEQFPEGFVTATVLEHLVGDTQPKKRGRKADAHSTIVAPTAQRGAIVERAQAIFESVGPSNLPRHIVERTSSLSEGVPSSGSDQARNLQPGRQKAARVLSTKTKATFENTEMPPSTQTFARSALGAKLKGFQHGLLGATDDAGASPPLSAQDFSSSAQAAERNSGQTTTNSLFALDMDSVPDRTIPSNEEGETPNQPDFLVPIDATSRVTPVRRYRRIHRPSAGSPVSVKSSTDEDLRQRVLDFVSDVECYSTTTPNSRELSPRYASDDLVDSRLPTLDPISANMYDAVDVRSEYGDYDFNSNWNDNNEGILHFEPMWEPAETEGDKDRNNEETASLATTSTAALSNSNIGIEGETPTRASTPEPMEQPTPSRGRKTKKATKNYIGSAEDTNIEAKPAKETQSKGKRPVRDTTDTQYKTPRKAQATPGPRSKGKRRADAVELSENASRPFAELPARIHEMILADNAIYLRILRYEPIRFEEFEKMAEQAGFPTRGLKAPLRAFLDSQAIQYYAVDGTVGRSRVRKQD